MDPSLRVPRDPLSVLVPFERRDAASANSRDRPDRRDPEEAVVGPGAPVLRRAASVRWWAPLPPSSSSQAPGPTVENTLPAPLVRLRLLLVPWLSPPWVDPEAVEEVAVDAEARLTGPMRGAGGFSAGRAGGAVPAPFSSPAPSSKIGVSGPGPPLARSIASLAVRTTGRSGGTPAPAASPARGPVASPPAAPRGAGLSCASASSAALAARSTCLRFSSLTAPTSKDSSPRARNRDRG